MSIYIQEKSGEAVVQTALRMPVWLRDKLKEMAAERGQSLNTFIVRSLKRVGQDSTAQK